MRYKVKYKAIIFDLFGTLVEDVIGPPYTDLVMRIASVLSMPADDFRQMWSDTVYARHTGAFRSTEANIVPLFVSTLTFHIQGATLDKRYVHPT